MKRSTVSETPAAKRPTARRAAPAKRRKAEPEVTPEQLEESLEDDVASALGGLDPDALEEIAALEAVTSVEDVETVVEDPVDAPATADDAVPLESEDDDEPESDLDMLLTGMLTPKQDLVEDEDDDDEAGSAGAIEYVPTARGNEFVCTACFLIWNRRHLADAERRLCRDCIDDAPAPARTPAAAA